MSKVQAMAPGKLYVAGEYAVVDGSSAIVVAVNRYVTVTIDNDDLRIIDSKGKTYSSRDFEESDLSAKDFDKLDFCKVYGSILSYSAEKAERAGESESAKKSDGTCESDSICESDSACDTSSNSESIESSKYKTLYWSRSVNGKDILVENNEYAKSYSYVLSAMSIVDKFVLEKYKEPLNKVYNVRISSDLDDARSGRKYGLGSSAAVTVAVVRALCEWYGLDLSTPDICKLALIASAYVKGSGSGGDIAASVYGGWITYRAYNRDWLKAEIELVNSGDSDLHKLVSKKWPRLEVKRLDINPCVNLLVGWTGTPASSAALVNSVKSNNIKQQLFTYEDFCLLSEACVQRLAKVLEECDFISIASGFECNRQLLKDMGELTQTVIETPSLTKLIEDAKSVGAAAKTSGAGGGDCGIALIDSYSKERISHIKETWKLDGIKPLNLKVAKINGTGKSSENIVLNYKYSEKLEPYIVAYKKKYSDYGHMDFDDIRLPHNSDPVTAEAFAERNAKLCDSNGSSESSSSSASSASSENSENSENELSSNNFSSSTSSNNISSNNKVKEPYNTLENAIKDLESQITSSRKNMHLTLADKQYKPHSEAGFDDISFMPNSLPDLSLENIDTSVNPLGCSWSMPLYINAMTGGSKESKAVNAALARVAAKTNMPMASGSLSAALRDSSLIDTFSVIRKENPKGFVLANVSAGTSADNAMRAVEMINANALQVHLNVAQELVMPEGDRDFSNWMRSIEEISIACQKANIPMIVKETGCGMTAFDAHRLYDLGVRTIDVGGRGGTNFVTIENARRDGNEYDYLASWGLTTVESLIEVMREPNCANKNMTVFASGGVRTPLDVVRAIALGAQAVGVAGEFLHTLMHSGEEVLVQQICDWTEQIRRIMALLGVEKVQDIQSKSRFVLTGKSAQFKANSFNLD